MKMIIKPVAMGFLLALGVSQAKAQLPNPVAWWQGEGNLLDSVGTNNGTIVTNFLFGTGRVGLALTPVGGSATVPSSPELSPTNQVTVSSWVKAVNPGFYRYMYSKGSAPDYAGYTGDGGGLLFFTQPSGNFHPSPVADPGLLWDGAWHQFVAVFDGSSNHMYVDGVEVGSGLPAQMSASSQDLVIGDYQPNAGLPFVGSMDDFKIYTNGLTGAQVLSGFLQDSAIVSWWRAENDATDVSGTNNGSTVGTVTYVASKNVGTAFNTAGGVVVVPDSSSLRPAAITLEALVKATTPGTGKYIVSKSYTSGAASYALSTGTGGGVVFTVTTSGGTVTSPAISPLLVWDGTFHHIAGTYDGQTVRLYLDGVEVGAGTAATGAIQYGTSQNSGELLFGDFSNPSGSQNFNGAIDDVKIYATAHNLRQIKQDSPNGVAILIDPQSQTVQTGSNYVLSVFGTGNTALSYQWRHAGTNIPGATSNNLVLNNIQSTDLGSYDVLASSAGFAYTSPGHDGTGAAFSFIPGRVVVVPDSPSLQPQEFTVQCWVRRTNAPTPFSYILSKSMMSGWAAFALRYGDSAGEGVRFYVTDTNNSFANSVSLFNDSIWDGGWHQVTGTFSNGVMNLYIDGTIVNVADYSPMTVGYTLGNNQNRALIMGDYSYPSALPYGGDLDDVKIFSHALSDAEVSDTYTNQNGTIATTGLISWWKADGTTGIIAADSAGSNNGNTYPQASSAVSNPAILALPVAAPAVFTNVSVAAGSFHASVAGPDGQVFVVQKSSALSPATWVPVVTNTVPFSFTDPVTAGSNQFYRAVAQ